MDRKLLSLYGLKFNPFSHDVPVEALLATPPVDHFNWRMEHLAREGGFSWMSGPPGTGKSSNMRLLQARLSALVDVRVGIICRPQGGVADFYRELGDIFAVQLSPHNRWAGAKVLRQQWQAHIEQALYRPVLIIDEAQEMIAATLTELRLLCSSQLDSRALLTVVLAGDHRLPKRFRSDDLLSLSSRMQIRLTLQPATVDQLLQCLRHRLRTAGTPKLMTAEVQQTLCEHAAGNYRSLMHMAAELLAAGLQRDAKLLDEKLFFEVFTPPSNTSPPSKKPTKRKRR
jgi:general secretion pathway protein A